MAVRCSPAVIIIDITAACSAIARRKNFSRYGTLRRPLCRSTLRLAAGNGMLLAPGLALQQVSRACYRRA